MDINKAIRGIFNAVEEEGIQKGIKKGIQEGKQEGKQEGINETEQRFATDMLKDGKPISEIIRYSRLAEDTIRSLADSLGIVVV